jgi:hypothetical protein
MFRWMVRRLGGATDALVIATWVVLGFAWARIDGPSSAWLFRGGLFGVSIAAMLTIGLLAAGPRLVTTRLMGLPPLCWVGRLSYSLYLWHWPLFVLLDHGSTGLSGWPLLIVRFAVSFGAASVSVYLVENPVRFRAVWSHGARGAVGFGVATALLIGFWVLVPRPNTSPADLVLADLGTTTAAVSTSTSTTLSSDGTATTASTPSTSSSSSTTSTTFAPLPATHVIVAGDSVAFDEEPALLAAFGASGVTASLDAFPGAGIAIAGDDPIATFRQHVQQEHPDVVVYQLSVWDVTAEPVQRARYREFTDMVLASGAALVFVTPPPIRADQQNPALARLPGIAADMVAISPARVVLLDSVAVWGSTYAQDLNGDKIPERKPDGVHICPSGAARFAVWLLDALATRFAFTPAPAAQWATLAWTKDVRYRTPAGICANLP